MLSFGIYAQSDTLNQKDSLGKKQGYWIIYGKDEPQKGFPEEGKIAEGTYLDDRRDGRWIFYYRDGVTPRRKSYLKNSRPNGSYEKYHPDGVLMEKGSFKRGKYLIGEWTSYWENGNLQIKRNYNEDGKRHGKEFYYFESGQVELEAKYNNGVQVDTMKFFYRNGDIKSMVIRDSLGRIPTKDPKLIPPESSRDNDVVCFGKLVDTNNVVFKPDGYNKLYNKNKYLLIDGEFKNGCLWDGNYYIYGEDGLLMKIENYKEGRYHSDGQL